MIELAQAEYDALVESITGEIARQAAAAPRPAQSADLRARIESTLLAADATAEHIGQLCDEAAQLGLAAVCVNPNWVALAARRLRPTSVLVVAPIGFPLGATLGTVKLREAEECLKLGADELDLVINLGALRSGDDAGAHSEIAAVASLAHAAGARLKVILETGLLTSDELTRAAELAIAAGADFLKTSTGFGPRGASVADVVRLRAIAGGRARIKAAGGIRSRAEAEALIAAGADRIGTSRAADIVPENP